MSVPEKASIYDLGFETFTLELTLEEKEALMKGYRDHNIERDVIYYLKKHFKAFKILRICSSDPKILIQIQNSGLKIIRMNFIKSWRQAATPEDSYAWQYIFFHFVVMVNQAELDLAKLLFDCWPKYEIF